MKPAPRHTAACLTVLVLLAGSALLVGHWHRPAPRLALEPQPLGYRIDPNTADAHELALLPGIGPGLADNILAYRQTHGPFTAPADLEDVHMIGATRRQQLEPWIQLPTPDRPAPRNTR